MDASDEWTSRSWTSADGLVLHARDYPAAAGPARLPVLCLHGLTRTARDFDVLAPWIAAEKGRRVLALDVRGRGHSARDPAADYRVPTYAADVAALMAALGLARAVFVGTSMGGLIAMELAAARPELIAAAVVNDVGPELGVAGLTRIAGYVGKPMPVASWDDAARYLATHNGVALPHYAAEDWGRMARRMFREAADGAVVADYDPDIAKPFADEPLQIDPWDRWRGLVDGRPVLLLRGDLSDLLEADAAARMAAGGNVRLVEVPGVGHAPMLDEPEALAAIDAFLDRVA